jgi:hypothetical protein
MNLEYAVERLYETGWHPTRGGGSGELETLDDGRRFPSVASVKREFARSGLELSIKHNIMFGCHRATWAPKGRSAADEQSESDAMYGTVIGACEREAAVYALAQLLASRAERQLATV